MNLDELRTVQATERQKDSLQHLRPSFYREVGEYINDLEAERDRIADTVENPFASPEVGRLTDEIETAKDVVEAVYERRMGKLVKQASLSAAGLPADDEGLTAEEQDLFDDLVSRIESNKTRVLDVLAGEIDGDAVTSDSADDTRTPADGTDPRSPAGGDEADVAAGGDDPAVPPQEPPAETTEGSVSTDSVSATSKPTDSTSNAGAEAPADTDPATGAEHATGAEPKTGGVSAADVMGDGPSSGTETANEDDETDAPAGHPIRSERDGSARDGSSRDGDEADESRSDGGRETNASGSPPARRADVERVTVRITEDVGAILGVDDREYTLANDDVVTLPEQNASPLVERDAAEPLE